MKPFAMATVIGDGGEANWRWAGLAVIGLGFVLLATASAAPDRSRPQVVADLARIELWNNGNSNVWTLPLPNAARMQSASRRG